LGIRANIIRHRFVRNFGSLAVAEYLLPFITVVFTIVMARELGAAEVGVYYFAVSLPGLFIFAADLGINLVMLRDLSKNFVAYKESFNDALSMKIILVPAALGLFGLTLHLFFSDRVEAKYIPAVVALGFSILMGTINGLFGTVYKARERMEIQAAFTIISTLGFSLGGVTLLLRGFGLLGISVLHLINTVILILANYWVTRSLFLTPKLNLNVLSWVSLMKKSYPYAGTLFLDRANSRVDSVLLTFFAGPEATGIYGIGYRVVKLLIRIPRVIRTVIFPSLARKYEQASDNFAEFFELVFKSIFVLSTVIMLFVFVFAGEIIETAFGSEYTASVGVLRLLTFSFFFVSLQYVVSAGLVIMDKRGAYFYPVLIASVVHVLLDILLIPLLQHSGAALATAISSFLLLAGWTYGILDLGRDLLRRFTDYLVISVLITLSAFVFYTLQIETRLASFSFLGLVLLPIGLIFSRRIIENHDWKILGNTVWGENQR